MKIEVTSASKKSETLSKAPAAIFVITGDDIRRGGFSSVPDALRMVPDCMSCSRARTSGK